MEKDQWVSLIAGRVLTLFYIKSTLYTPDPKLSHLPLDEASLLVKVSQADPADRLNGINKPIWRVRRDESDFYLSQFTTVNKAMTGEISCKAFFFFFTHNSKLTSGWTAAIRLLWAGREPIVWVLAVCVVSEKCASTVYSRTIASFQNGWRVFGRSVSSALAVL